MHCQFIAQPPFIITYSINEHLPTISIYAQSALRSNLDREREKKYIHTINYIYQRCCINKQEDTDGFNSVEWLYQNNNYSDFIKAWCVKITLSKKTLIGHLINWQEIKKKVTKKIHNESHISCVLFFYACKLCIACIIYKILFFTSFLFSFFFIWMSTI